MPTVRDVTKDLAVAGLAGYVGTKAMEPVSMALGLPPVCLTPCL